MWISAAVVYVIALAACASEKQAGPRRPQVALAVATSVCSPLTYGGEGRPRFVVPLVGPLQNALSDDGIQNAQAIKLVMQQRGWRAGENSVAIQLCDEASTDSFSDKGKCERNARKFADNHSVIVVVGPLTSSCAAAMLPPLNGARGGPVALVGIGNTYLGLTRHGPGVEENDPERLYPSGLRSYLRTVPADDVQAAAAVMVAHGADARRPFVVHDDSTYGRGLATAFQEAARKVGGMTLTASASWDPKASGYSALARSIRRHRADAVYVAGFSYNNGPRLIRDLRAGLGHEILLLGPDGFDQPNAIVEGAGGLADGFTITVAAANVRALPVDGKRWAAQFRRRWAVQPCCYTVHAGVVMQLVLDAIAASDGTRAQVLRNLQRAEVKGRLVGDFRFDRYGDTTLTAISVYVIRDGRLSYLQTLDVPRALLSRK
ncbi:MAG: branched-chain amino acid transport system substrate-binding protein [Solirubrobacteraceae bacterium]|jgi:ABC-type branched-subunit amino acid transport system substrate-binding protein|nr:branched-chain amino acid transport system substrate-binding protein [Solirubrobacteraceae bacterium]